MIDVSLLKDFTQIAAFGAATLYFIVKLWRGELTPKLAVTISSGSIVNAKGQLYLVLDFAIENTGDMNIYAQDVTLEVVDPDSGKLVASQIGRDGLKQLNLEPRKRRRFKKYRHYNIEAHTHLSQTAILAVEYKEFYFVRCTLRGVTRWGLQTGEWRTTSVVTHAHSQDDSINSKAKRKD
jgi:hypothetical protein